MPTLIDTSELVYAYLAAQPALATAITVGTAPSAVLNLFGPPGLPPNWTITKALMFLGDGGPSNESLPVEYETFQFRCYAPTLWDSSALYRMLVPCLLHISATPVTVTSGTGLLIFAERVSGPHGDIEPQTLWPYVMSTWRLHIGQYLWI